jgi:hypothetical protein
MIKVLITMSMIFLIFMIISKMIKNKLKNFIDKNIPQQNTSQDILSKIIYSKDDVVVMQGESKKERND